MTDRSWISVSYPIGSVSDEAFKKFEYILSTMGNEELASTYINDIGADVLAELPLEYWRLEPWMDQGVEKGARICNLTLFDAKGWLPTTASTHML